MSKGASEGEQAMDGFMILGDRSGEVVSIVLGSQGLLVATWFLAGVFAVSGGLKVRQPMPTAMAMVSFGVLRQARNQVGFALGFLELGVALLLAVVPFVGLVFAAPLLWLFTLLIIRSLFRHAIFPCFCFGDAHEVLSGWTLVRTTALAILATGFAIGSPPLVRNTGVDTIASGIMGVAILGALALAIHVPALLHDNRDPFRDWRAIEQ